MCRLSRIGQWLHWLFLPLPYPHAATAHPIHTVMLAAAIGLVSLCWALLFPAVVASYGEVFWQEDLEKRVDQDETLKANLKPDFDDRWKEFKIRKQTRKQEIDKLKIHEDLTKQKQLAQLREEQNADAPPIVLIPFFRSPQMWLRPVEWMCLAWLIILARPPGAILPPWRWWWIIAPMLLYTGSAWPHYLRNFWQDTTDRGRIVFAYPNWDIHPWSFVMQEVDHFLFSLGLAVLWWQWATYSGLVNQQLNNLIIPEEETKQRAYNIWHCRGEQEGAAQNDQQNWNMAVVELRFERINVDLARLSETYVRWQVASLLLVVPFAFDTWFYYKLVGEYRDFRYISSAVLYHALWGVSWIMLSLPVFFAWHHWHTVRILVLTDIAARPPESQEVLKALLELQPVPFWNLSITIVGTVGAFLLPLIKLFHG